MACLVSKDFQPFPETGKLAANKNLSLTGLVNKLSSHDDALLYSYVVDMIELHGSDFVQTGSGPNFQGDLITLCTCKHRMRTGRGADEWRGIWIAGLSGKTKMNGLVYLMKVSKAFKSQYDLWRWLPSEARQAKSACLHRLGDVFEPNADCILLDRQFDPKSYKLPHKYHAHAWDCRRQIRTSDWHEDINYLKGHGGRKPALLVGDPEISFLWSEPIIRYKCPPHPRTKKWESLQKFLKQLKEQEKEH